MHRTDGRCEAQLVCDAASDVVTLVATIRAGVAPLLREYDRASGALLRVGDGDDRPSRTEMLLRLLQVTGRVDAASCFADATRAPQFHLRWAAMREWLALDAAAALPRLAAMARDDAHAEVRAAAAHMIPIVEQRLAANAMHRLIDIGAAGAIGGRALGRREVAGETRDAAHSHPLPGGRLVLRGTGANVASRPEEPRCRG